MNKGKKANNVSVGFVAILIFTEILFNIFQ